MKAGSSIHKTLEDQVHRSVPVDIQTKEDAWGLRLWNVIQGLQTLRETGMTREFEVWGILEGEVVNGVIDELSYICPDSELEAKAAAASGTPAPLPPDQHPLTDFLSSPGGRATQAATSRDHRRARGPASKIYILDVKTRSSASLPNEVSFRPTQMQLMLYQHLLSGLATNSVDASVLFKRYSLNPDRRFTDAFIAKVGSLNEIFYDAPDSPLGSSQVSQESARGSLDLLLEHSTLRSLWKLMTEHYAMTFPRGRDSVGDVLKVEYRSPSDGKIRGAKTLLYDAEVLEDYIADEMDWWKGNREAQGVVIEEAYKCGICEFSDECDWRKIRVQEGIEKIRLRRETERASNRSRV
jgi:exonuclease V